MTHPFLKRSFDQLKLACQFNQKLQISNQILKNIYQFNFLKKLLNYINNKEKNNNNSFEENEEKFIKINNLINTFENPIRALVLQKIFEFAYNNPSKTEESKNKFNNNNNNNNSKDDIQISIENSFNDLTPKNRTYIYENLSSENDSLLNNSSKLYNSLDDNRLHRVYKMIEEQKKEENEEEEEDSNENIKNNYLPINFEFLQKKTPNKSNSNENKLNSNENKLNSNEKNSDNKEINKIDIHSSYKSDKEIDISAERDPNEINWEFSVNNQKEKSNDSEKNKKIIKNDNKNKEEEYDDFIEGNLDDLEDEQSGNILNEINNNNYENDKKSRNVGDDNINIIDENKENKNDEEEIKEEIVENIIKEKKKPFEFSNSFKDSSRRNNRYGEDDNNNNKIEIKIEKEEKIKPIPKLTEQQKEKIPLDLTEEIIKKILNEETKNLLPKKNYSSTEKIEVNNSTNINNNNNNNETSNSIISNVSLYSNLSDIPNYSNSYFMRNIKEITKEKDLNSYNEKIAPHLIHKISKNIDKNFPEIINNLKQPYKLNETDLLNGIAMKEEKYIESCKPVFENEDKIKFRDFFNKDEILSNFHKIDMKLRNNNINEVNEDEILNEAIVDCANELLEDERLYGTVGEPLKWSIRNRENNLKFENKNNMKKKISQKLKYLTNFKMGKITENYENYDTEQLTNDRDKKFFDSIKQELDSEQMEYENEETQIKCFLSKVILDQLLNELVEILEHVMYSRREPARYQNKSIYACEDIPRLSFQNTTENVNEEYTTDSINQ